MEIDSGAEGWRRENTWYGAVDRACGTAARRRGGAKGEIGEIHRIIRVNVKWKWDK
jgi:hypothetical protein